MKRIIDVLSSHIAQIIGVIFIFAFVIVIVFRFVVMIEPEPRTVALISASMAYTMIIA